MILLLYLQQGRDVTLDGTRLHGTFHDRPACESAAARLRGALPVPQGHDAAWQDALCTPLAAGVRVKESMRLDIGTLLRQRPPVACQGEGTWRRLGELCARR